MDALACALEIQRLGMRAKEALQAGRRELTLMYIGEMQLAAKDIQLKMCLAKVNR